MDGMAVINIKNVLQIICPALLSLLAAIVAIYINKLRRRVQENNGIAALEVFDRIVDQVVRALNQTVVKRIKRRITGSMVANDIDYVKNKAIESVHSVLEDKTKKDIKYIVKDLDSYIDTAIESKVKEQKDK